MKLVLVDYVKRRTKIDIDPTKIRLADKDGKYYDPEEKAAKVIKIND